RAADEHRRPRHRQRPEAVDDALLQVVREAGTSDGRAEDHGLRENPRDQELAVAHARDVDRAAEHVDEQQDEHDRRERGEDQQVGHPLDLDQVALGDDSAVAEGLEGVHSPLPPSFVAPFWSAARPVNVRNTSSSVGRRRATSCTAMPAASSPRSALISDSAPPVTGAVTRRLCSSTAPPPSPKRLRTRCAPSTPDRSATTISTRSPPTCVLSWSAVPLAMARP